MRAILVEDDGLVREHTRTALTKLGYGSVDGDDLVSGLDVLTRLAIAPPPELIVIDIVLPGAMDGIDVMCGVRNARIERDWWPKDHVPAIVMTSGHYKATDGIGDTIRRHRAVFLQKPYSRVDLADAIEEAKLAAAEWDTLEDFPTPSSGGHDPAATSLP